MAHTVEYYSHGATTVSPPVTPYVEVLNPANDLAAGGAVVQANFIGIQNRLDAATVINDANISADGSGKLTTEKLTVTGITRLDDGHITTDGNGSLQSVALSGANNSLDDGAGNAIIDSLTVATNIILVFSPPTHNTSAGTAGMVAVDAGYVYVCTATNTWKRVALNLTSW